MKNIYLSVIIPAYNEEKNLEKKVLDEVANYLAKQKYTWEVLVVDDGSTDKTRELVKTFIKKNPKFKLLEEPHRGKGGTVIHGMLAAKGEIILFTDMDQATPITELDNFLPVFKSKSASIVIGTRSGREGAPLNRKVMAYGFTILRTLILRLPYKDTQCGFKAFTSDASKQIFKRMKIYSENKKLEGAAVTAGFDLEILYIARKLKLKVKEVPVNWHHKETKRISPIKDSIQALKDLIVVRLNALQGKYNIR